MSYLSSINYKNYEKNAINIMAILTCLIPLALVSGSFLGDFFLSIIAVLFLFIKNDYLSVRFKNYVIIFFIYNIYIILNSITSIDPFLSLESSLFYFRYLFFVLGVIYIIENKKYFIFYFSRSLYISLIIIIIDSYVQFFTGANILGNVQVDFTKAFRMSGAFGNYDLVLGRWLAHLLPLAFALLSMQKKIKKYEIIISLIMLVAIDVLVFISGERTAFLMLTISTILIIFFIRRFKFLRLVTFCLSILIITFITASIPEVKERNIDYTLSQMGVNKDRIYSFSPEHERYFITALNMFKDNPIFGHGTKTYRIVCKNKKYSAGPGSCSTHPHNTYMQLLAETGIVGIVPIILIFASICYKYFRQFISIVMKEKNYYLEDYQVCLLAALFIVLWPITTSLNFYNNWISILYYLPIPFMFADINRIKSNFNNE